MDNKLTLVNVRLEKDVLDVVDELAAVDRRSRAAQAQVLIEEAIRIRKEGRVPVPISIDTVKEAREVPRTLRPSAPPAIQKKDPVYVAPTKDNIPGMPQRSAAKGKPAARAASQMTEVRELASDDADRARVLQRIAEARRILTPEEQKQPTEDGLYSECGHGRNVYRCEAVKCKMLSNRA